MPALTRTNQPLAERWGRGLDIPLQPTKWTRAVKALDFLHPLVFCIFGPRFHMGKGAYISRNFLRL